ncbi:MAG: mandelate racemase/muconate lactonizing enzyme family protein [Natronomonas sp.]|uniref:mandelate racemase/muconate lactonizing enzyme family protein n=1 Tax=Natronomonas sp. TaxID=2184060 RepID=UPI00286FC4E3|nr:mandelate racemase/muconate lactonizing enzyme family protein [Natronomonas sp.]MDR9429393.1 mandelate racemase/muconate lactonizing enzyme family protein [Natronomonas sp.]
MEASDGTVGWGECWGPIAGTRETVEEILRPVIVGANPMAVERLYDRMYHVCRAAYQSIVPLPAISGVDIALWDLKGKLSDQPVSELLGGRRRDKTTAYATGHYFQPVDDLEEQYRRLVAEAKANADLGAIKLKVGLQLQGYGPEEDLELVRRVRSVVGDDVRLMVDANYAYEMPTAREAGERLGEFDVHWFEEPFRPESVDGYAELTVSLPVRIAGGECHTPVEFDRLLVSNAVDVAQPDLCNVGGNTPARRIADRVRSTRNVEIVPNVWGMPIAIAASLQYIGMLASDAMLEFDRSPNPLREELCTRSFVDDDGRAEIPTEAGLGVELDRSAIETYRVTP